MPILTPEERIGSYIAGRYRLDSILGEGGMGVVYAGTHTWTDRRVAVKILSAEFARNETVVQRFLQEARTAASLRHPSVVDVLDMGEDADGTVFLVLELLEGEPLVDLIEREGPLDPARTLDLLIPIMRALEAAHRRGVVHRDIKPDNIFVTPDEHGQPVTKLLDFGIAKVIESASTNTATGSVIGTPYYMSPEQAAGSSDVGPASDVWSMGVVLYQCLSNDLPFDGPNPTAVLLAIATGKAPALGTVAPSVPKALTTAIDRSLEHDRRVRYERMSELIDALVGAAQAAGVPVRARGARESVPMVPAAAPAMRTQAFDRSAPTLTPGNAPSAVSGSHPGLDGAQVDAASYSDLAAPSPFGRLWRERRGAVLGSGAALAALLLLILMLAGGGEGATTPPAAEARPREAEAGAEPAETEPTAAETEPEPAEAEVEEPERAEAPEAAPESEARAEEPAAEGKALAPREEKRADEAAQAERARKARQRRIQQRRLRQAARRRAAQRERKKRTSSGGGLMREW
ncbi:MAG: serine/threonine-protein kinase [Myxococcota bacterium]